MNITYQNIRFNWKSIKSFFSNKTNKDKVKYSDNNKVINNPILPQYIHGRINELVFKNILLRGFQIIRIIDDIKKDGYFFMRDDLCSFICSNLPDYKTPNKNLKIDIYWFNDIYTINNYDNNLVRLSIITYNNDILLFEVDTPSSVIILKNGLTNIVNKTINIQIAHTF